MRNLWSHSCPDPDPKGGSRSRLAVWALGLTVFLLLSFHLAGCGQSSGGTEDFTSQNDRARSAASTNPVLASLSPTTIAPGKTLILTGRGFGVQQFTSSSVEFVGPGGARVFAPRNPDPTKWTDTRIEVVVPEEAQSGPVKVLLEFGPILGGRESNSLDLAITAAPTPDITAINPAGAAPGDLVTLSGTGFGDVQLSTSEVLFQDANGNSIGGGTAEEWTDTRIRITVPTGAVSGPIVVKRRNSRSSEQDPQANLSLLDRTAPTLASSSPANQTTGVDLNTQIVLTFSERMDVDSATTLSNYRLTSSRGPAAITSVTVAGTGGNTFAVTPQLPLAGATQYTLALSNDIRDLAGNQLIPANVVFITDLVLGSGGDFTAPTLASSDPVNNATGVDVETQILLTFSEPMDPASLIDSANSYRLTSSGGPVSPLVATTASLQNSQVLITPGRLAGNTTFSLSLRSNLRDASGNRLSPAATVVFTTQDIQGLSGADVTSPQVLSVTPANSSTGVDVNTRISIVFSEPVRSLATTNDTDANSASNPANYRLTTSGGPTTIRQATIAGNTVQLTPDPLIGGTGYFLSIASNIQDKAGNFLTPPGLVFFQTNPVQGQRGSDLTSPELISSNPVSGTTGISPNTDILLVFSESMNDSILTTTNYILATQNSIVTLGSAVRGTVPNSVILTPASPLEGNATFTLFLTSNLQDAAQNRFSPVTLTFTTFAVQGQAGTDLTPPQVIATNPPNGATNVSRNTGIQITFSEPMNEKDFTSPGTTEDTGRFSVKNPNNYEFFSTAGTVGITSPITKAPFPPNTFLLTPARLPLDDAARHVLIVQNTIRDAAGNSIITTNRAFTTIQTPGATDTTTPSIININPQPGQKINSQNTAIIVQFSEAMSTRAVNSVTNTTNYLVGFGLESRVPGQLQNVTALNPTEILTIPNLPNAFQLELNNDPNMLPATNREYFVELSNRIQDVAGNALSTFRWDFTLGVPPTIPKVLRTSVDNSPVSSLTSQIIIDFDQNVINANNPDNYAFSGGVTLGTTFSVASPATAAPASRVVLNVDTITEADGPGVLEGGQLYTLSIGGGSIRDGSEGLLELEPFSVQFTTSGGD